MIYVETSVVLAQLLAEDRCPPESLWTGTPVSSRLTEYEVWTRVHARGLGAGQRCAGSLIHHVVMGQGSWGSTSGAKSAIKNCGRTAGMPNLSQYEIGS